MYIQGERYRKNGLIFIIIYIKKKYKAKEISKLILIFISKKTQLSSIKKKNDITIFYIIKL